VESIARTVRYAAEAYGNVAPLVMGATLGDFRKSVEGETAGHVRQVTGAESFSSTVIHSGPQNNFAGALDIDENLIARSSDWLK